MPLDPIRIGVLFSTTGTMALNETSLRDVVLMEVKRINADGGILGRMIEPFALDPGSDWMRYRDMAHSLVHDHGVTAIFGCWTSVSRKSVLPVVEQADILLFYPLQYEGEEQSPNVFYLGATPNQQAIPALEYLMSTAGGAFGRFFFIGTDYIYPTTTNRILRSYLLAKGMDVGTFPERYVPFGHTDWQAEIDALKQFSAQGRGAVISTVNGDSNLSFYRAMRQAGIDADKLPVMALSVSEAELESLDPEDVVGHYACWEYFMSQSSGANLEFLKSWRNFAGNDRPVYAPMAGVVLGFRLWCKAVTAAGTTATAAVRQYMLGQSERALNGSVCVMGVNHHIEMAMMVGRATRKRQFEIVWHVLLPIPGDPWAAARIIAETTVGNAQRELLEALPTPLLVLDEKGEIRYRSASTNEYFGDNIDAPALAKLQVAIGTAAGLRTDRRSESLPEITVLDTNGRVRHLTVAVRQMVFAGLPAKLLSLIDITETRVVEEQLRVLNEELQRLASTDVLTGVNNRRHFVSAVNAQFEHMRRHRRPASIFILDLDDFKSLNDRYGHEFGDRALTCAATTVRLLLRGQDIFARIGGEEFAGYLPDTDVESAMGAAERLRAGIADLRLQVGVQTASFTCSVGVTPIDIDRDTFEKALARADAGLYAAKNGGRNRVQRC